METVWPLVVACGLVSLEDTAYYSIHEESLTLLNERKKPIARLVAAYFNQ